MHSKTLLTILCSQVNANFPEDLQNLTTMEEDAFKELLATAFANLVQLLIGNDDTASSSTNSRPSCPSTPALTDNMEPKSLSPRAGRFHGASSQLCKSSCFDGERLPEIDVKSYLTRIVNHVSCSKNCFLVAMIYLDRLIAKRDFVISVRNIHRLLIASVIVATKLFEDTIYNNVHYAYVGGIPLPELNRLELELLILLDFDLHVTETVFDSYFVPFEKYLAKVRATSPSTFDPSAPISKKEEVQAVFKPVRRVKSTTEPKLCNESRLAPPRPRSFCVLQLSN